MELPNADLLCRENGIKLRVATAHPKGIREKVTDDTASGGVTRVRRAVTAQGCSLEGHRKWKATGVKLEWTLPLTVIKRKVPRLTLLLQTAPEPGQRYA